MENDHNNSKKGKCILVEPYSASNVIVLKTHGAIQTIYVLVGDQTTQLYSKRCTRTKTFV